MYDMAEHTSEEIQKMFCEEYDVEEQEITDERFVQILNVLWKHQFDMNMMGYAYGDLEDNEFASSQDYKDFVLWQLQEDYLWADDAVHHEIQNLFIRKKVDANE